MRLLRHRLLWRIYCYRSWWSRRSLVAIVALVGGLAGASAYLSGSMRGPIWDTSSRLAAQTVAAAAYAGAWFEFAPLDGGALGLDTVVPLCSAVGIVDPTWKSGQSGCWTQVGNAAGTTMSWGDAGTWTAQSDIITPNGASGGAIASVRVTTGSGFQTEPDTSAPANLSGCVWMAGDDTTDINFFGKGYSGATATSGWFIERQSAAFLFRVSDGTTLGNGATLAGSYTQGAVHVACFRYIYSGTPGTTSTSQVCVDGACGAVNSTTRGPINSASIRTTVGKDSTFVYKGRVFGVMTTEKDLTAAGLQSIETMVLASNPRGITSDGDAGAYLALTRATVKTCPADTTGAAVSILPSGRPCITMGGLHNESAGTNDFLQSETLCAAPNTDTATCTANTALAPAGTLTAETLNDTSAVAALGLTQAITTSSLTRHAFGCYVMAGTATAAAVSLTGTGNSGGDCTATATGLSASSATRLECTSTNAYAAGLTAVTAEIDVGTTVGVQGTVFVWGCQHEVSKFAGEKLSSYIPTTSASATRNLELSPFGMQTSAIGISGSAAATLTSASGSPGGAVLILNTNARPLYMNTAGSVLQYDNTNNPSRALSGSMNAERFAADWGADGGGGVNMYFPDGGITHGTFAGYMALNATDAGFIGGSGTTLGLGGVIKGVCIDPSPTRCR